MPAPWLEALCKEYSHCSLLWPQASPRHSGQTLTVLFDAVPALASLLWTLWKSSSSRALRADPASASGFLEQQHRRSFLGLPWLWLCSQPAH